MFLEEHTPIFSLKKMPPGASRPLLQTDRIYQRDKNITDIVNPYAYLSMEVAQLTDTLEIITEINPLAIAEILGNIGGFWGE